MNEECSITSTSFNCPSGEVIDFDNMCPSVFICIGTGDASQIIQKSSDDIAGLKTNQKATHVAVGGYSVESKVRIWESHFSTKGLREKTFDDFLEQNKNSTIFAYPYQYINLEIIQALTELDLGYGVGDIVTNKIASWNKDIAKLRGDSKGLICSEAVGRSEPFKFIHRQIALWNNGKAPAPWLIQPVHYQRFFLQSRCKGVRVR